MPSTRTPDPDLETVVSEIQRLDPTGRRIARVLRDTLDQLYDGQRSGRYRWDQLHKTEKTHCGTLVEINLNHEFRFGEGQTMDYRIAGIEVDCKFSQSIGGWMIPLEAVGHICLLLWANDQDSHWSLGIIRISEAILTHGGNRDSKRSITAANHSQIRWIFNQAPLPTNILLQLPRTEVDRMMAMSSGQKRVNEIFRVAQGRIIGSAVIATLARQKDYMKRIRGNGGARSTLQAEGIIILGQYRNHQRVARDLGIPVPDDGESVAVRVIPAQKGEPNSTDIEGSYWKVANDDENVLPSPEVPYS